MKRQQVNSLLPNVIDRDYPFAYAINEVFVNGRLIDAVFYINQKKGLVKAYVVPYQLDKHKKRLLTKTFYGKIDLILDQAFLDYAIEHKQELLFLASPKRRTQKRRLIENETMHRLPSVPDTQHEATRLLPHRI